MGAICYSTSPILTDTAQSRSSSSLHPAGTYQAPLGAEHQDTAGNKTDRVLPSERLGHSWGNSQTKRVNEPKKKFTWYAKSHGGKETMRRKKPGLGRPRGTSGGRLGRARGRRGQGGRSFLQREQQGQAPMWPHGPCFMQITCLHPHNNPGWAGRGALLFSHFTGVGTAAQRGAVKGPSHTARNCVCSSFCSLPGGDASVRAEATLATLGPLGEGRPIAPQATCWAPPPVPPPTCLSPPVSPHLSLPTYLSPPVSPHLSPPTCLSHTCLSHTCRARASHTHVHPHPTLGSRSSAEPGSLHVCGGP